MALVMLLVTPAISNAYDQEYVNQIQELYLKSFNTNLDLINPIKPLFSTLKEQLKYTFSLAQLQLPELSTHELRNSAFRTSIKTTYNPHSSIDLHCAQKMELVIGAGAKKNEHLAARISTNIDTKNNVTNLLHTECGKAFLINKISQPHTDTEQLIKCQRIINACANSDQLRTELTSILHTMGKAEKHILSYYSNEDLANQWASRIKHFYYWQFRGFTPLNNSSLGLQAGIITENIFQITGVPTQIAVLRFLVKTIMSNMKNQNNQAVTIALNISTLYDIYKRAPGMLNLLSNMKLMYDVNNLLQEHLIDVATYIDAAKKVYTIARSNPEIAHNFSTLSNLEVLLKPSTKYSAEINELMDLLSTTTFKGKASVFSYAGRIIRVQELMNTPSVRTQFIRIINTISELDTYVALAHKISSTRNKKTKYCLVKFDTTNATPYFKADGLWNPFINDNQAITNTVELGGTQPCNIVLSGPNTGGKSTLSKAVLLNSILAQTFGIAAATHITITPFSNLDCYMNMTDDTASGVSGLQAEVNRAQDIIERLENAPGFSLFLLDEIFTATSPEQAEALAVEFISILCENPHCMFIDAAHFDGLTKYAEQSKDCRNCHMGAEVDNRGTVLKYTYKLAEGRSTVKNAQQVAQKSFSLRKKKIQQGIALAA